MTLVLAWLAPWLLGAGLWLLASGRPRSPAAWAAVLGGGWLLGMLLTAWALTALGSAVSPRDCVLQVGPWIAVIGLLAGGLGWWRQPPLIARAPTGLPRAPIIWALAALLGLLLVYRAWLLFGEASLRPLFVWDAWLVWSIKPKAWFLLDQWAPFVDTAQWLASSASATYTDSAAFYPALIGRLQVWFASGAGCWCEPAFMVLWPALWVAVLVAGYGQLRALGVRAMSAWIAVYALGSLPLWDTHAALAGYADIWLGACFALTLLCWLRWQVQGDWRQMALALALGLSLPWIKLEGAIWLVVWLLVAVLGALPARWRWRAVLAAIIALVIALALGGFSVPLPGLGWVHFGVHQVRVPGMHPFDLGWHPALAPLARALWVLPNWHLLFYLAPLIILWRWRVALRAPGINLLGLCLLGGAAFLFVLFNCTGAAVWASNYTSSARLLLQWAPALVFYLALLCGPSAPEPRNAP